MNMSVAEPRATGRPSSQSRPEWPDVPHTLDAEAMHPRAVEMAQSMREGADTFRGLIGAGFTHAEITEFHREAKALATSMSTVQRSPGGDLLSDLVTKAQVAAEHQRPMPRGTTETQALLIAWSCYCRARNAFVLDPWPSQRERCLVLLAGYMRQTAAGAAVTKHVIDAVDQKLTRVQ